MTRLCLTDRQWSLIEPLCLGKPGDPGRSGSDNRMFIEGILWVARTGSPWRDLPPEFGKWNTAFRRYRDWVKADVFARIFEALSGDPDMEYACVDATIVKVRRANTRRAGDHHHHGNPGAASGQRDSPADHALVAARA